MPEPLLPEFRYAIACCRWSRTPEQDRWLREQAIDWPLFLRIARRHRIEGLAWRALRQAGVTVPADVAGALQAAADRIGRDNLAAAAECARLAARFDAAAIPLLFVKGLTLSALAYGSIVPKAGWDIDILVGADDLAGAASLLQADGYEMVVPLGPATPERIAAWHQHAKESVWRHPGRGIHVELHTALADHPMLLAGVGIGSPRQKVRVAEGIVLPTLRLEELFAYLAVHGASSAWFRLKWIADLAALLEGCTPEEIAALYRRSQELGGGRAAALAVLLLDTLFATPLPPALVAELRGERANRRLVAAAMRSMSGRAAATELDRLWLGTAWIHLTQFGLLPGPRYKLSELRRQVRSFLVRN
ncbi:nucleotidyltransferase family protein [Sphingosinicella sp. YJ22]|uniref:nucleotidyltransferase family protein n=1 Tax=Sphingosinicella sp. YJ22 TaxID=1104780 RepID=UPI00140CA295|nr:nucleotidyltransferase family protein [Sphingosinicella sp. YJ22]